MSAADVGQTTPGATTVKPRRPKRGAQHDIWVYTYPSTGGKYKTSTSRGTPPHSLCAGVTLDTPFRRSGTVSPQREVTVCATGGTIGPDTLFSRAGITRQRHTYDPGTLVHPGTGANGPVRVLGRGDSPWTGYSGPRAAWGNPRPQIRTSRPRVGRCPPRSSSNLDSPKKAFAQRMELY